jgi:hypothetical protein
MGQAVTAAIPLQAPTPSRVLDELSGQIGKMAPTALIKLDDLSCMGSSTARGSSSASHLRGEDVAFSSTERDRHLGIRPVSLLDTQPVASPVNASS